MAQPTKYFPLFFAPDLDPSWLVNPGVLTACTNMVPTKRGSYINCGSTAGAITATFDSASLGVPVNAGIIKRVDGTGRLFVATKTRLLEVTDTATVVDRSKGATAYATASTHRYDYDWDYTSFGNDVIFVNKNNPPQMATSSATVFANVGGGPPKAACCTTQKNFVLLGNCNDGTNDLGDQVWWSALGNDQSYTADAATQAGNYRLRDTPGNVTALVNMRDTVVAYKTDSIYIGDYQGSPLLWTWRLVTDQVGCPSAHGVVVVDGIHYFIHTTGVFRFDGASVQPIGQSVNSFLIDDIASADRFDSTFGVYDEYRRLIIWYYSSGSFDASPDTRGRALAYQVDSNKYGYLLTPWDTGTCNCPVKATLSDINAWDSALSATTSNIYTVGSAGSTGKFKRLFIGNGTSDASGVTLGDIGDGIQNTKVTRIQPRMLLYSGSLGNITVSGRTIEAGGGTQRDETFVADSTRCRWDGVVSGKWVSAGLGFTSFNELAGVYITSVPDGTEP